MGGLRRLLPVTHATSLVAMLAIAGVPPLAGFFSKDAILVYTLTSEHLAGYGTGALYGVLLLTAVLTAFYMFRWYHGIFGGASRMDAKVEAGVHESPAVMTVPLTLLAGFSAVAGFVGLPAFAFPNLVKGWLQDATLRGLVEVPFAHPSAAVEWAWIGISVAAALGGLAFGWWTYARRGGAPVRRLAEGPLAPFARSGMGVDGAYGAVVVGASEGTADGVATLDRDVVDRGLLGLGSALTAFGRLAAGLQTGFVRTYAFAMFAGAVVLALVLAWTGVRG
jgi:NADH-quinone oxidoreductase subunit L